MAALSTSSMAQLIRALGGTCEIQHVDGTTEAGHFPQLISPHQPFKDCRSIIHEPKPGLRVEVKLEGDTFEMEDQRNWTDASFKTYCTPHERPFPVTVKAGERVQQTITLSIEDSRPKPTPGAHTGQHNDAIDIEIDEGGLLTRVPEVGLGVASHGKPLSESQAEWLRQLGPAHLRVDVVFEEASPIKRFERAAAEAARLGVALEVALHLTDDVRRELHSVVELARRQDIVIARWLIYHDRQYSFKLKWIELARNAFKASFPDTPIVGGANGYFVQLNRCRPPMDLLDGICYSINPQVHAFDNDSLVETLQAQADTVRSAREFSAGRPIVVSPVTLRPRFNPNETGPKPEPPPGELPTQVDPRQPTLFAAAWTLGSLKYLSESGVDSITYFETTGWRGVLELNSGALLPDRFPSIAGSVFPLYHVLCDVNEFHGGYVIPCRSSHPLAVEAMILEATDRKRIILANVTAQEKTVRIASVEGHWSVRRLDASTQLKAATKPKPFRAGDGSTVASLNDSLNFKLLPHAIITLDKTE